MTLLFELTQQDHPVIYLNQDICILLLLDLIILILEYLLCDLCVKLKQQLLLAFIAVIIILLQDKLRDIILVLLDCLSITVNQGFKECHVLFVFLLHEEVQELSDDGFFDTTFEDLSVVFDKFGKCFLGL